MTSLNAHQRLAHLFDQGVYQELFRFVQEHPSAQANADALVCAHGEVNGQAVLAYATEVHVQGGSLGAKQTRQIVECQRLARQSGIPLVALLESGGARISEAQHILEGFAAALKGAAELSGVVPQVACVFGHCIGAAALMATLGDWVIMESQASLSIAGARVNALATGEALSEHALGGHHVHQSHTGNVHFVSTGDAQVLAQARELLSWLPPHHKTWPAQIAVDSLPPAEQERQTPEISTLLPADPQTPFDMQKVLFACADQHHFFEIQRDFAPNLLTGFMRINGYTVAVVANQSLHLGGVIDVKAARKYSRFLTFINGFNFPLVSFVDVPGALPTLASQQAGILTAMSQSIHAVYNLRTLRLTVLVRRCFGGTFAMLHPKSGAGDLIFAYPQAMLGVMSDQAMQEIMAHSPRGQKQIQALNKQGLRSDDPLLAASHGYIDDIIDPAVTRQVLYRSLKSFYFKRVSHYPDKLLGNPPL